MTVGMAWVEMVMLSHPGYCLYIGFEWSRRPCRKRKSQLGGKGSTLQVEVVGHDHQWFQVHYVLGIIGYQRFQCLRVPLSPIFPPQKDGKKTVDPIQFFPV